MSNNKRGLGRGLESLIPTEVIQQQLEDHVQGSVGQIPVAQVKPNPHQPRTHFDEASIKDLAQSLDSLGLIQPIVVVKVNHDEYQLIAGERRLRAAKLNNWKTIDAVIRDETEQRQAQLALVENIQRDDLSALEVAAAYVKLLEEFNFSFEQLSKSAGRADTTIRNTIRLLNLPENAKEALKTGQISEGHARQVLAAPGKDNQQQLVEMIVSRGWSVRQAEQFVKSLKDKRSTKDAIDRTMSVNKYTRHLQKALGLKVKQKNMAKGGRIIIEFKNDDELQKIVDQLG